MVSKAAVFLDKGNWLKCEFSVVFNACGYPPRRFSCDTTGLAVSRLRRCSAPEVRVAAGRVDEPRHVGNPVTRDLRAEAIPRAVIASHRCQFEVEVVSGKLRYR
jgi:hypothetical protein